MKKRTSHERGGSVIEFALLTGVWLPLLVGTMAIGTTMVRGLQAIQVARDSAHMYALGIDFTQAGNQAILAKLAGDIGSSTASGNGLFIFSTLTYVGKYVCEDAGYADASTPPNPTSACKNYGHFVFTERYAVGNPSLRSSNFGSPSDTGTLSQDTYVTQTGDRADLFKMLPAPQENGSDGYQAGQPIYVVEVFFKGAAFAGYTQGGSYAIAIF